MLLAWLSLLEKNICTKKPSVLLQLVIEAQGTTMLLLDIVIMRIQFRLSNLMHIRILL
jgi:hypothetical protein